ncbi:MAG: histidine phosphatase family protein [Sphingomonadaceae bacterium]
MPVLSLLRHAKSSWDDPVERDFDRPLNKRGHRAARRIGQFLADEKLRFDLVLASPAVRVRETIEGVEEGMGAKLNARFDERIYLASAAMLYSLVQETPDDVGHLLLIGHNPGLEDMALLATLDKSAALRREVEEKYPTATLATLEFPGRRWAEVDEGRGHFVRFVRPRDLDPSLGPVD